jgi:anti-anti-sigma factor
MIKLEVDNLEGDIKRIRLTGSLDIEGTEAVNLPLTGLTSTNKVLIVLDLSEVTLMASLGIGLIIRCFKAARLRGGNLVIFNPQPGVALVLERTSADKVITITNDLEQACKKLRDGSQLAPS